MVHCLDPAVEFYEAILDLLALKDPYKSALFLITTTLALLYYEAAISISLLGILIMI